MAIALRCVGWHERGQALAVIHDGSGSVAQLHAAREAVAGARGRRVLVDVAMLAIFVETVRATVPRAMLFKRAEQRGDDAGQARART